jgi:hypothetical protein
MEQGVCHGVAMQRWMRNCVMQFKARHRSRDRRGEKRQWLAGRWQRRAVCARVRTLAAHSSAVSSKAEAS